VLKPILKFLLPFLLICGLQPTAGAQPVVVADEIVAVVGNKTLLHSEIDLEIQNQKRQSANVNVEAIRCDIFNQLLIRKFMLLRADLDSLEVGEDRVDAELNKRVTYFVSMYGSESKMEEAIGKSVNQLKNENRDKIRDELLIQQQREKLVGSIKVSPNEVVAYFNKFPKDSLPNFDAEVEIAQIVRKPKVTAEEKLIAYEKISNIRRQILTGTSFRTMALLYSDDKGSARNGGEMDEFGRGVMVAPFEAMAFRLQPDTVSPIIETEFGYHIMQLLYRKGDHVKVRHILIRPVLTRTDYTAAFNFLDSLRKQIAIDSIKFEDACKKYSDDERTNYNGGFFLDQNTGSTRIPVSELDEETYKIISKLKPGQMTEPVQITEEDGSVMYRMLYLKSESPPHQMNLKDDYQKIQAKALETKQYDVLKKWLAKERTRNYYSVKENYKECLNKIL
jgi:peptidyl-prolyl cis-trans isomerase SurA